jgi:diaminohydroxyphosphoribosylaminopyrimidine deaminase/5-amino-6-(5-phosphoribosylamino)uracil reductase
VTVRNRGANVAGSAHTDADLRWLREAIELSRRCPPSDTAFSVGAALVSGDQARQSLVIATGFSRERDPHDHAEETALAKAAEGAAGDGLAEAELAEAELAGATMYTSLEPCLHRLSRPRSCAQLIVAAGIRRVVLAWLEPPLFVPGGGARWLRDQGVTVLEVAELADEARAVNAHLLA